MEDERGTFRPVMARKEREREGKESSDYLTGSMGHGGDFLRLATASQLSALSSLVLRGSAQRQSQKAKARARVNQANRGSWPSTFTSRP